MGFDYKTSTALGETDSSLGGHKQNLAYTRTQGKGAVIPQETEPDLSASVGGSSVEARASNCAVGTPGSSSLRRYSLAKAFLEVVINPTIDPVDFSTGLPQAKQQTGREHSPRSADSWIKVLLSMALPTRARPSFCHCQLLPSGSLHKIHGLSHQRAEPLE